VNFVDAVLAHEFLRVALAAGLLAAVGCGVVGTLVVVKRITFMAGGIAHAVLGGMGVAHLLGRDPLIGAAIAAVVAALLVGWIARRGGESEDMLIGALWAVAWRWALSPSRARRATAPT
jgi:ABC-type Mn2+/Zn2+ transport systems, permease components